jgi:DNA-binding response OmpR family regulator
MKILILDDNILVLKKLSFYLNKKGHKIIESTNAMEALSLVLKHQPDLVITDLLMPYLTGSELYRTLSYFNKTETKMLFITSLKDKYIKELDKELNEELILKKPINYDHLDMKIAEFSCVA